MFVASAGLWLAGGGRPCLADPVSDPDAEALGDWHPDGPRPAPAAPVPTPAPEPAPPPPPTVTEPAPVPAAKVIAQFPVEGRVLTRGGRDPAVGAAVLLGGEIVAETDEDGRFRVALPEGRHTLQIQQPGFDLFDLTVDVAAGRATRAALVRLHPRQTGERYETVVVPPERRADGKRLRAEELTRTPGSLGDPLRVIESMPGVSQVVWPLALYAVRGANPGNTGFFLDGVRLPMLYHFALGPSVVHPFFIEQVDFYPGGYPATYGRYVSGIVDVKTRTPSPDRARGSVDVRLFDAGGIVATPFNGGKGTIAVAGRVSYTGLLFSLFSPDFTMNYWDYQARIEHRLGPGRLSLFVFGSGDDLGRKQSDDTDINIMFHRATLRWDGRVAGGRLTASTTAGFDRASAFIPQVNNLPVGTRSLSALARVGFVRPLGRTVDVEVGADFEAQRITPDALQVVLEEQDVLRKRRVLMHGGHATLVLRPWERLLLSPGVRYDLFVQEGVTRLFPGPRLNARLRLSGDDDDGVFMKGTFGRFAQLPSLPIAVPGFENFGLSSIGLQTGTQGALGVEAPLGRWASLDVTGFVQRFDVTDLKSIFNFEVQTELLELRPGRSYGVEFMVRRPIRERLYGWAAYTLSKSERALPQTNARARADWDQRHILNLVGSYRFDGGYQVGARFHYQSGRPYPVFDQGSLSYDRQAVDYMDLPAFYQIDLRFDKRWIFDTYKLDFYVELINTTLTRQVYDVKRLTSGALDQRGFRAALPSVGLHAEW